MAHTVIPPPRGTTATLELTHKGNINDKTIPERDMEVRDRHKPLEGFLLPESPPRVLSDPPFIQCLVTILSICFSLPPVVAQKQIHVRPLACPHRLRLKKTLFAIFLAPLAAAAGFVTLGAAPANSIAHSTADELPSACRQHHQLRRRRRTCV